MIPGSGPLIFAQYWLVTAAALILLLVADDLPRAFVFTGAALLALSFFVQGTFLEGRSGALTLEVLRLALTAAAVAYWHDLLATPLTLALFGYCAVSLLAAWRLTTLSSQPPAAWTSGQS